MVQVKTKPEAKDEKRGKVRRFLEFLHIKKKPPKVYDTSPELQRYELDMLLEDIEYYIGRLPDDHAQKKGLQSSIGTLDRMGDKDIKDATQRAQGLYEFVKNEVRSQPKPTAAPLAPAPMQQAPPQQPPAPQTSPKAKAAPVPEGYDQPPDELKGTAAPKAPPPRTSASTQAPPKPQSAETPEGYAQPPDELKGNVDSPPPKQKEPSPASASASPPPPPPPPPPPAPPPPPEPPADATDDATLVAEAKKDKKRLPAETLKELKVDGKPLGTGNFSTSYKMKGPGDQEFAVKVPRAKQADDANQVQTETQKKYIAEELANAEAEFKREAEFYDRIQQAEGGGHPNIAKCYGYQTVGNGDDAQQGLVMEMIDGDTAQKTMTNLRAKFLKGEISSEEYFGVMQYTLEKMLEAAKFLGEQGVSHRDMKPDNVMIDSRTGDVKLVDFGVSREIGEEYKPGKVPIGFVPPEIAQKPPSSAAEDPFGVGGTAYMWSEQQVFDYHKKEGQGAFENMKSFVADDGRAIEVAPQDQEARDFRRQLDLVKDLLDEWKSTNPQNLNPVLAVEQSLQDVETQGADKEFKKALEKLKGLQSWIRSLVPDDPNPSAQKQFAKALKQVERRIAELDDSLVKAKFVGEPFRLKSLLDSIRPLVAKARQHGDRMEFEPGLAVLAEASARLKEAEAPSGQHNAETLFTDFMNALMHPDPEKRLTPEEALNHPFMKSKMLDEDAARRVLKAEMAGPAGPAKPADTASDETKWKSTEQTIYEAKRRLKGVGSCLPDDAPQRQKLLTEMQLLPAEAAKAAEEVRKRKEDPNNQMTQKEEKEAVEAAANLWKKFCALDDELKTLLAAAQKDLDERKAVQAELNQVGRLVQGLASRTGADISDLEDLFKQARALSKPGGSLVKARKRLTKIQSKVNGKFGANEKRALLTDGLAQSRAQIDELEKQAKDFEDSAKRDALDAKTERATAEQAFKDALKHAANKDQAEDEEKQKEAADLEAAERKASAAARMREENYRKSAKDNTELAKRRRDLANDTTTMLAQAESLGEDNLDKALAELDRASELLRVTLAEAAKTPSKLSLERDNNVDSGESTASHEEQARPRKSSARPSTAEKVDIGYVKGDEDSDDEEEGGETAQRTGNDDDSDDEGERLQARRQKSSARRSTEEKDIGYVKGDEDSDDEEEGGERNQQTGNDDNSDDEDRQSQAKQQRSSARQSTEKKVDDGYRDGDESDEEE
jgi:serine/threonine protein kinase